MARANRRPGSLRIIGGEWRGQRIDFPPDSGIRPTSDRVRETLFNWLQFALPGAHCLDLYAGSGALGFEALSRGAASAILVEREPAIVERLERTRAALGAERAEIRRDEAGRFLDDYPGPPFGIVFLDPPFTSPRLSEDCARLAERGLVRAGGLVYLEAAADTETPSLPTGWRWRKRKKAGQVCYYLAENPGPSP